MPHLPADSASPSGGPAAVHVGGSQAQGLTAGIVQRSVLSDLLVRDLADRATVVASGLLPPDVLAGTLGWHIPIITSTLGDDDGLLLTSVDMVRNADGSWTVLSDRTSIPYGLGLLGRFGWTDASPFGLFRSAVLAELDRRRIEDPVLLFDPGTFNPDENVADSLRKLDAAELTSAFGLRTLTARGLRMHRGKLIGIDDGERPIRTILRYVPLRALDPLEPRSVGTSGVPGIAGLIRSGEVRVLNPGAAVVHNNPALAKFLPQLARHFLGEDLLLPPVTTYWCGDRAMCSHVISGISRLVLRSISGREILDGRQMTLHQCAELCARISDEPWDWVGQEPVEPDAVQLPDGSIVPVLVRGFAVGNGSAWTALEGGLAFVGELDDRKRPVAQVIFDGTVA
ncbi:MAG TPA: circularly permuted type 2 ATP-grasp protein [Actinomycetaceae bacterium]|nr:circularly permuted type 2 ATP-grasp protein [Actinomycetaceae bacterium]